MNKSVTYYVKNFDGYIKWLFTGIAYFVDPAYIDEFLSIYHDAKEALGYGN